MRLADARFGINGYPMPFTNKEKIIGEREITVAHNENINVGDEITGIFAGINETQLSFNTVYTVKEVVSADPPKGIHKDKKVQVYTLICAYTPVEQL